MRAAVITASTGGYNGTREDTSGDVLCALLKEHGYTLTERLLLPDDRDRLARAFSDIADSGRADLILTTGGTGFSPTDVTPEATTDVCERLVPGIPEAMRAESAKYTNRAMLSRAAAGIRGRTLIINLPGSPKAVRECFEAIIDAVGHGLDILTERSHNCAR